MRWIACLLAAASAFAVAGCAGGGETATTPAPSGSPRASAQPVQNDILDPHGNVVLYISNQSFEIDPVDIAIEVDGQPVLDRYFDVGGQHNFERFVLRLAPGKHVLTAKSIKGKASLRKSFSVRGKRWITVSYWYYTKAYGTPTPRQLDFRIDDQPVGFD